jgi:hypothetical protein
MPFLGKSDESFRLAKSGEGSIWKVADILLRVFDCHSGKVMPICVCELFNFWGQGETHSRRSSWSNSTLCHIVSDGPKSGTFFFNVRATYSQWETEAVVRLNLVKKMEFRCIERAPKVNREFQIFHVSMRILRDSNQNFLDAYIEANIQFHQLWAVYSRTISQTNIIN